MLMGDELESHRLTEIVCHLSSLIEKLSFKFPNYTAPPEEVYDNYYVLKNKTYKIPQNVHVGVITMGLSKRKEDGGTTLARLTLKGDDGKNVVYAKSK